MRANAMDVADGPAVATEGGGTTNATGAARPFGSVVGVEEAKSLPMATAEVKDKIASFDEGTLVT